MIKIYKNKQFATRFFLKELYTLKGKEKADNENKLS